MVLKLAAGAILDLIRDADEAMILKINDFMAKYPYFIAALYAGSTSQARWILNYAQSQGDIFQSTHTFIDDRLGDNEP